MVTDGNSRWNRYFYKKLQSVYIFLNGQIKSFILGSWTCSKDWKKLYPLNLINSKWLDNFFIRFHTGVYRLWLCITFGESESKQWKVLRFPDKNLKTEYFCEKFTHKKLGVEKFSWVNWEISLFSHFSLA
jgi:hypothetical protein